MILSKQQIENIWAKLNTICVNGSFDDFKSMINALSKLGIESHKGLEPIHLIPLHRDIHIFLQMVKFLRSKLGNQTKDKRMTIYHLLGRMGKYKEMQIMKDIDNNYTRNIMILDYANKLPVHYLYEAINPEMLCTRQLGSQTIFNIEYPLIKIEENDRDSIIRTLLDGTKLIDDTVDSLNLRNINDFVEKFNRRFEDGINESKYKLFSVLNLNENLESIVITNMKSTDISNVINYREYQIGFIDNNSNSNLIFYEGDSTRIVLMKSRNRDEYQRFILNVNGAMFKIIDQSFYFSLQYDYDNNYIYKIYDIDDVINSKGCPTKLFNLLGGVLHNLDDNKINYSYYFNPTNYTYEDHKGKQCIFTLQIRINLNTIDNIGIIDNIDDNLNLKELIRDIEVTEIRILDSIDIILNEKDIGDNKVNSIYNQLWRLDKGGIYICDKYGENLITPGKDPIKYNNFKLLNSNQVNSNQENNVDILKFKQCFHNEKYDRLSLSNHVSKKIDNIEIVQVFSTLDKRIKCDNYIKLKSDDKNIWKSNALSRSYFIKNTIDKQHVQTVLLRYLHKSLIQKKSWLIEWDSHNIETFIPSIMKYIDNNNKKLKLKVEKMFLGTCITDEDISNFIKSDYRNIEIINKIYLFLFINRKLFVLNENSTRTRFGNFSFFRKYDILMEYLFNNEYVIENASININKNAGNNRKSKMGDTINKVNDSKEIQINYLHELIINEKHSNIETLLVTKPQRKKNKHLSILNETKLIDPTFSLNGDNKNNFIKKLNSDTFVSYLLKMINSFDGTDSKAPINLIISYCYLKTIIKNKKLWVFIDNDNILDQINNIIDKTEYRSSINCIIKGFGIVNMINFSHITQKFKFIMKQIVLRDSMMIFNKNMIIYPHMYIMKINIHDITGSYSVLNMDYDDLVVSMNSFLEGFAKKIIHSVISIYD